MNQKAATTKLHVGIRAGGRSNEMKYFVDKGSYAHHTFTGKNGYTAGIFVNLSYKDKKSVQPELLLTQKVLLPSKIETASLKKFLLFHSPTYSYCFLFTIRYLPSGFVLSLI